MTDDHQAALDEVDDVDEFTADLPEEEFDHEHLDGPRRSRTKMHCFHCNRPEVHFLMYRGGVIYSFFVGMTFGLIYVFGPFRCQCCGHSRLMKADYLHPLLWTKAQAGPSPSRRKRKRSSRR